MPETGELAGSSIDEPAASSGAHMSFRNGTITSSGAILRITSKWKRSLRRAAGDNSRFFAAARREASGLTLTHRGEHWRSGPLQRARAVSTWNFSCTTSTGIWRAVS